MSKSKLKDSMNTRPKDSNTPSLIPKNFHAIDCPVHGAYPYKTKECPNCGKASDIYSGTPSLSQILDKVYATWPAYMGQNGVVEDEEFNEYDRPELETDILAWHKAEVMAKMPKYREYERDPQTGAPRGMDGCVSYGFNKAINNIKEKFDE